MLRFILFLVCGLILQCCISKKLASLPKRDFPKVITITGCEVDSASRSSDSNSIIIANGELGDTLAVSLIARSGTGLEWQLQHNTQLDTLVSVADSTITERTMGENSEQKIFIFRLVILQKYPIDIAFQLRRGAGARVYGYCRIYLKY